jgi:hypothetical protein
MIWPGFRRRLGLGVLAHDVLGEDHVHAQQLGKALCHGGQGQALLPLPLGLAQMGAGDDGRAVFQQILDGGQSGHDALVAGDLAGLLVLRDVEIAAKQNLFVSDVDVQNCFLVVVHKSLLF